MRVAVTGATGLIGSAVLRALRDRGDEPAVLTRNAASARRRLGDVPVHEWADPEHSPPPPAALAGAAAIVHLAGAPVAQRWSVTARRAIRDSRVLGTRSLVAGIGALPEAERPRVLLSQSASGYYGARGDEWLDEDAAPGGDFLARLVVEWEREAAAARDLGLRVVTVRTGVVLSPRGGALERMLPPFRLGIGGPVAGWQQYVPWIHLDDVAGALLHCSGTEAAAGPVNLAAPGPVTNAEFSRALGAALHRPAILPVPGLALRLLYGEMSFIVTTGQRLSSQRLRGWGYSFAHPELPDALRRVLSRGGGAR